MVIYLFLLVFLLSWETDPRKHWHDLCQRMFCLCSHLGFLWYHVLHFSLFKLFWVNNGDLDSVWSTSCSCRLVRRFNTPVPSGCLRAARPRPSLGLSVEARVSAPALYTWADMSPVLGSAARWPGPSVRRGSAFHGGWLHSPLSLRSSVSVPADLPASEQGSQGQRTFLLSQFPPRGTDPVSIPFFVCFSLSSYLVT